MCYHSKDIFITICSSQHLIKTKEQEESLKFKDCGAMCTDCFVTEGPFESPVAVYSPLRNLIGIF